MPAKDRHGKTAQDYRAALVAELDAVPDYRRRPRRRSPLIAIWLLVPVALLWLNWPWLQRLLAPPPPPTAPATTPAEAVEPPRLRVIPTEPSAIASTPQSLDTCLKPGNVVDDDVLRCRYGALPQAKPATAPAQGMVSAAYLAQYRAERDAAPARTASADVLHESQWVRKWDGSGSYQAVWTAYDNRIDYGSVCQNHRAGSINYRECRKGAKQWFKEQCSALRARSGQEMVRERYCSAAAGFGPMG